MNFWGNFFRKNKPKKSKYLPKKKELLKYHFKKFTSNGGNFYCEKEEELNLSFQNILFENQITSSDLFSNETSISEYFN